MSSVEIKKKLKVFCNECEREVSAIVNCAGDAIIVEYCKNCTKLKDE